MTADTLGDRMKEYEGVEAQRRLMPLLPAMARLDGRAFHTFTKGLERPYDQGFSDLMVETMRYLVENTNALIGYTQSDEITLTWLAPEADSQIFFAGRVQKMCSILAAMASSRFNEMLDAYLPEKQGRLGLFDCRVWNVPNKQEGTNVFLWREWDATKNSVSMAAQHYYSHKELHGKDQSDMHEMLFQKGVNWNDYPSFFKRGTYAQRKEMQRPFTGSELKNLPEKHEARRNPNLLVTRHDVMLLDMPPLARVVNRVDVIYSGAEPITEEGIKS